MKSTQTHLLIGAVTAAVAVFMTLPSPAATNYVWHDSPSPSPPYADWSTAAHVIQDAVDTAQSGDTVLVTNGVYATGGRAVYGTMINRVAVTRPVTVRSVNGPEETVIQGYQVPGTINGDRAIRCVYLSNGAVLSGFTLTHGATRDTPAYDEREQNGGGVWCESANALITNCTLTGNSAWVHGGGAYFGTLNHCTLTGNSAQAGEGGGANRAALNHCTLTGNSAGFGGGACGGTLNDCALTGNSASGGGGACDATLNNCTLTANSVSGDGGGAYGGTLNNCLLAGNTAYDSGGGASGGTLNNCTLTGNSARNGGGASYATLNNCIVYYNSAGSRPNYDMQYGGALNYCCTTPLPSTGTGNIADHPQLASASHLSADSPCRGAGSAAYATGVDIDGELWLSPPSMGCDEYWAGAVTGALTVAIGPCSTNVAVGFALSFTAQISGRVDASAWDFGDGTVVSNRPYASHAWAVAGDYPVVLRAYNESHPEGMSAAVTVRVVARPVHYVSAASANPLPPYSSWETAARTIQEAVDAAAAGGEVLVTNGVYATGGKAVYGTMTNRVAVTRAITVRSVNGPEVTIIQGYPVPETVHGDRAIRCVYLGDRTTLSGFTLTNGATHAGTGDLDREQNGGGVWCESASALVTNCTLSGNTANYCGGGAYRGSLSHCTLSGNVAQYSGGGAFDGTLSHCTLIGNWAAGQDGGGACGGTFYNCTFTGNAAYMGGGGVASNWESPCILYNCALTGNAATVGGGAWGGTLHNCTLTGNSASEEYGGVYGGTLRNCIVYFNTAPNGANYGPPASEQITFTYSCTTPAPPGTGNMGDDPAMASTTHLSANSPCLGAGSSTYATGLDIDGEPWLNPPCMGADQYVAGQAAGLLSVAIEAGFTNVATGFAVPLQARIQGAIAESVWDFGDGVVVSNRPYLSHAWSGPGTYAIRLTGYNTSYPEGVTATLTVQVVEEVYYVNQANPTPAFPYTSWQTAATCIQDAIGASARPGRLVLVTNGVYATGGLPMPNPVVVSNLAVTAWPAPLTNRVALTNPVVVRSVNGPEVTVIMGAAAPGGRNGDGAVRCAYVGNDAVLSGFTLTNGHTQAMGDYARGLSGGGAWCQANGLVTNCVLIGNAAPVWGGGAYGGTLKNSTLTGNSASGGGGAYGVNLYDCVLSGNRSPSPGDESYGSAGGGAAESRLYNCVVTSNSAGWAGGVWESMLYNCILTGNSGGGAFQSMLYNCTLAANSGGGAYYSTLYNCIVYDHTAPAGSNHQGSTFSYSCTTPLPPGSGNIDAEPGLVNLAGGDFRLRPDSPCVDAGTNLSAFLTTDLEGNPRPFDGNGDGIAAFDMGAYELSAPLLLIAGPHSQTVYVGEALSFSAHAIGPSPLHYQWQFDGVDIASATNSTWALSAVTTNQAGAYRVIVTNALASVTSAVAVLTVVDAAPLLTMQPHGETVFQGRDATLTVVAEGSLPLCYQWQFNGDNLPDATNATLTLTAVTTNQTGAYSVIVSNALGSVTSSHALLTVRPIPSSEVFQIVDLSAAGAFALEHNQVTGDDRGGIAASSTRVFYSGDSSTGSFDLQDLSGGQSLGRRYDSVVSDLKTETVYLLADGEMPLAYGGGALTSLLELDGETGLPTGHRIGLSELIQLSWGSGLFAGFGCVVVHNGSRVYTIFVPSGVVVDEGAMSMPNHAGTENWAFWGVAEYFDGATHLVYVRDSQTIVRSRVPDGLTFSVASFANLSDMACFTVCPRLNRWYFQHEGTSQFRTGDETIGYAEAAFYYAQEPRAPAIYRQPSDQTAMAGRNARFSVGATGYPLFYRWQFNGMLIPDATNSSLVLTGVTTNQAGPYSVVVSNALGCVTSAVATLIVNLPGTRYVWRESPNPMPPYTNWATAAHTIQEAVDLAWEGDMVLVTNGVYATGGRAVSGLRTNRLAITNAITVQSVNGPEVTWIVGAPDTNTWNGLGSGAVRCVYVGANAVLSRFTLTNGFAFNGGGVWCETGGMVTDCLLSGCKADTGGGGSGGTFCDCTLTGNSAQYGGGVWRGKLTNCTLTGNSAGSGGGAYESELDDCTLVGNKADNGGGACGGTLAGCTLMANWANTGGGVYRGTLHDCNLSGNSARLDGGGAWGASWGGSSVLSNCTLIGNSAERGGGTYGSTLHNCTLVDNSARTGGGAYIATLYNCTLTGNSAQMGGGVAGDLQCDIECYEALCALYNCIVHDNTAPAGPNYGEHTLFEYSCTTPLPPGVGNIGADPLLASATHLSASSPCIGAGNSSYASGVDMDGEPWLTPPCMGADQYMPGGAVGPLAVTLFGRYTHVAIGFAVEFTATIRGHATLNVWDFGDGTWVTNRTAVRHAWGAPGTYLVRVTGYNDGYPDGVTATLQVQVLRAVSCVDASSVTPVWPYTNWATAARTIQEAIGAGTLPGRVVLVANGVYGEGGVAVHGLLTNRVVLTDSVRVQSLNGPKDTWIVGRAAPLTTNGDGAIRCAYVGSESVLNGFTLTNGHTRSSGDWEQELTGGGAWCESGGMVTNCLLLGNSARLRGGGVYGGTVSRCTLTGNSASESGGAAYGGTLDNSTLTGNSAQNGGGACGGTLSHCTLAGNSAVSSGGGVLGSTLDHCALTGNSAGDGGGAYSSTLFNCTLTGNSAGSGAGAFGYLGGWGSPSTLYNCTLTGNGATNSGGGASGSSLHNCTVIDNSASTSGGGLRESSVYNSIVYYNAAPDGPNWFNCTTWAFSCTAPLPSEGVGNIDTDPFLDATWHLWFGSPCIGAASSQYAAGFDMDGEPWSDPPSMGADEYWPGGTTGALTVALTPSYTLTGVGLAVAHAARIHGTWTASVWDFGDGTVVSNLPSLSHAWSAPGTYTVRLTGYNDRHPEGVTATGLVQVVEVIHYVNRANATPLYPYTNWQTAATTIQAAVDATAPGGWVLVTNGLYGAGEQIFEQSCVFLNNAITVRSVNGPTATVIQGTDAARCAYVGEQSVLSGFTMTNGHAAYGGGVWSEGGLVTNCVLTGNRAEYGGGGAFGGNLWHCTVTRNFSPFDAGGALGSCLHGCLVAGNVASMIGGGVSDGVLYNCTVVGNSADTGGGAIWSTLYNSVICENTASDGSNHVSCDMVFSCTTPLPPGEGNIARNPAFLNPAVGDFRLHRSSPCIDAGADLSALFLSDLAGVPRPLDGNGDGVAAFDMGAYEFDLRSTISWAWFSQHGLDPGAPGTLAADPDDDGRTTYQEWVADTDPTNAWSCLHITSIVSGPTVSISVESSSARLYTLEFCPDLPTGLWTPVPDATDIPGTGGLLTLSDANAGPSRFYRISVRMP